MPQYSKTAWVDGLTPAINATNLNKLEQGVFDSIRQDGSTTMSAQFVTIAGSVTTPAIAPTGDSNTGIFFPAADKLSVAIAGTERVHIAANGHVSLNSTADGVKMLTVGTGGDIGLFYGQAICFLNNTTSTFTADKAIYNYFNGSHDQLQIQPSGTGGGVISFHTGTSAAATRTEAMRINPNGNVGIGTISPSRLLELSSGTNTYQRISSTIDAICGLEFYTNSVNRALITGDGNGVGITTITSTPIIFKTNNTEKMRITSDGNVLIGTTSALTSGSAVTGKLQLAGTTLADSSANFQNFTNDFIGPSFYFGKSRSATIGSYANAVVTDDVLMHLIAEGSDGAGALKRGGSILIAADQTFSASSSPASIRFLTTISGSTTATEKMRITAAGNVGIGTTSPTVAANVTTLCLNNTSGSQAELFVNGTRTGVFTASSTTVSLRNLTTNPLLFFTDSVERFQVESGGRLRPSATNAYELGSATFRWQTIYSNNVLNVSDSRLKTDVAESSLGLDFISALNPVQYRYIEGSNTVERVQTGTEIVEITPAIPAQPEVLDEEGNVIQEATQEVQAVTEEHPVYKEVITPHEGIRTHFGLIAQEVKAALPEGLDFAGWCLADKEDPNSTQSLGYSQFIAPMIKAIQELKSEVDALKAQLAK